MLELGSVIPPMSSYAPAEVLPLPAKPHQAQHQTYTTSPKPPNRKHNPSFHPHEIANEIPRVPTHPRLCHPPPGQAQRPEPRSLPAKSKSPLLLQDDPPRHTPDPGPAHQKRDKEIRPRRIRKTPRRHRHFAYTISPINRQDRVGEYGEIYRGYVEVSSVKRKV